MFMSGPHPPSSTSTLSRRTRVILDDGFCDFAFGSAQNDSIGGDVLESNENKGRIQSCSCEADSTHLTSPRLLHSQTGVKRMCYQTFPTTLFKGLQVLPI